MRLMKSEELTAQPYEQLIELVTCFDDEVLRKSDRDACFAVWPKDRRGCAGVSRVSVGGRTTSGSAM